MPIAIDNDLGHTSYLYTVQEVCKVLGVKDANGKPIGRNKFFRALRHNKIIDKNNQPYQYHLTMGLLQYHPTKKYWKEFHVPVFTERGLNYLRKMIEDGRFVLNIENDKEKIPVLKITDIC